MEGMTTQPQPWERQPGESGPAFDAFTIYRDHPDRSLRAVGQEVGKSRALLERWSVRHRWVERTTAWDDYLDATRRAATAETAAEVAARHVAAARMLQEKALLRLAAMHPSELTPTELLRFVLAAIHLEREAGVILLAPDSRQDDQDTVVALLSHPETRDLANQLHQAAQALMTPSAPARTSGESIAPTGRGGIADAVPAAGTADHTAGMAASRRPAPGRGTPDAPRSAPPASRSGRRKAAQHPAAS